MARYGALRDFPPSRASPTCPFICVSAPFDPRTGAQRHGEESTTWLNELIWRDFYFMILDHFPRVVGHAFKPEYDAIRWAERPIGSPPGRKGAPATAGRCGDAPAQP
jgi:deoxyribodipyrimidine photo-lyase